MKRITRTAAVAAAAVVATVLSACAGGGSPSEPAEYDEPVDLTLALWTSDEDIIANYERLADEFREDNPELGEFTVQSIPFDQYTKQLTVQLSGGQAPDLAWVVEANFPAFADAGVLAPIDAVEEIDGFDADDYLPNLISTSTKDDTLYGVPFTNSAQPVIYNPAIFEATGVDTPLSLYESGNWNWQELRRISAEVVAAGGATYGFDIPQFNLTNYQFMNVFMKGFGAESWPGGTECGFTSPESVEAFTFLHDMIFTDNSYPSPGEVSSFTSGDTAMIVSAPSILNTITDPNLRVEMVPQPEGANGKDYFLGQAFITAFADGKAPELSTRLLAYLTQEESAKSFAKWYVSGRESLLEPSVVAEANSLITEEGAARALIDPLKDAKQVDYPVAYPELTSATKADLDAVWQPDADIEAALEGVCAAADPILKGQ